MFDCLVEKSSKLPIRGNVFSVKKVKCFDNHATEDMKKVVTKKWDFGYYMIKQAFRLDFVRICS